MKPIVEKLTSIFVAGLGLLIMGAWLINQQMLAAGDPDSRVMVFNTAFSFTLIAIALLLPESRPTLRRRGQIAIACFVILFNALILLQDITETPLGLDQLFVSVSIEDLNNPNPGRTAPPTAISLMLCGALMLMLNGKRRRRENSVAHTAILVIMSLAVIGLTGTSVRIELLFDWYKYARMTTASAALLMLLSLALWMAWYRRGTAGGAYIESDEKRISVTGIIIIMLVALSSGLSGFGILANQMHHTLELGLKEAESNHLQLIQNEIELAISSAQPITTRLLLNRFLAVFDKDPANAEAIAVISEDARSFSQNFPAVAVYSASGQRITQIGSFIEKPDLIIPLKSREVRQLDLRWKNGPFLHITMNIVSDGQVIGSAVAERKLVYVAKLLSEKDLLGDTADTGICAAVNDREMHCLPSYHHPGLFGQEPRSRQYGPTSMDKALRGESGTRILRDRRGRRAITSYAPIADYGLGIVVKIETAEFYGPIREKLQYALLLILALSGIGIFLQSLQLVPLVKRLVQSEERVKSVNRFQQTLFDSANSSIIATDTRGMITVFNKTAERMLGYTAPEVVGKLTPSIFHDPEMVRKRAAELSKELGRDVRPGFDTFVIKARLTGSDEHEWAHIRKDGSRFPCLLSISCLHDEAGEISGYLGISMDITEHKRLEKLKNEFISTVSHELRTPLTSIRGSLGLMRAGVVGDLPGKAKAMTEIAYNNAERLILLINDILDIDKIESGQMRFDIREHDLGGLIRQAMEANQAYGERFGVGFVLESGALPARVNVDADRFLQVISNLLSNAAKFSAAGDAVRITVTREGGNVRISVIDKGPGISEEFHSRIFSKFAQADSSSSRQKGGTGLGLNISKQIIEYMKGRISFESEPGKGTTFWVELPEPVQQVPQNSLHEAIEYLDADSRNFLPRILHAEDDYGLCQIIGHSLRGKATMHVASSVAEASKLLKANTYDLLILDLALPDGTGLRLLQQIEDARQHTRVMILSASDVDDSVREKVALALVKSRVSESKVVEHILALISTTPPTGRTPLYGRA